MISKHVGIIGIGVYIPEQVVSAKEIAEQTQGVWSEQAIIDKLGIREKHVANDHEGTQEMGALASLACIKDAGIDAKDIDVILCFGEEWKEYPLTTSALYIQGRIGAINAWGIDVQNRCATTLAAIKMAKDMLMADDDIDTILVAGGYRNGDFVDYTDKNMSMMFNLGAGGGALLLRKNAGKNVILGSHLVADGTLAHTAGVEIGGQCKPITQDNLSHAYKSLRLMDPEKMKTRLNEVSQNNWMHCIHEACRKSHLSVSDIDYLNILHIKRSAHVQMLKDLGLTDEQTIYLEDYGHIGQIDQILSLYLALKEGKVKEGTRMCMIAAGIGYVWAASMVQWGDMT